MKFNFLKGKKIILACGFASLMLSSITDANAQKLNFSQRTPMKDLPSYYNAPMAPENIWVTNYKGSSFVINWDAIEGADNYFVDVFRTDVNNIQSFNEDFSGINSKDGYIDPSDPGFPEGWNIDVSTNGDKDMVFDGKSDKISMDANGDFIRIPNVNGYITSVVIDMNVINIPENASVDEENTSAIIFRLYDDKNFCVREGAISTLIFAEMQQIDLFLDLFSYLPPTITSVEFALEKNEQRTLGDLMVNSISYSYAPRVDHVKDVNVGNATSYNVENADPESIYFCNIKAANGNEVSEKSSTVLIDMLSTPEPKVTEQNGNSYTIGWQAVPRAQYYDICNYNIMNVEEDSFLDVLYEDFNNIKEGTFEDPVIVENPDEYTGTPGWAGNKMLAANGMFGADNGTFAGWPNPGLIQTPVLDLSGNGGKYKIHIKAYGTEGDWLAIYREGYVVDGKLNIHDTPTFGADGYIEDTWEMEDGVADMRVTIAPMNMKRFFIDEISITQERKAGDIVKLGINKQVLIEDPSQTSCTFDNLEEGKTYGFEMRAMRADDAGNVILSEMTDLQIVVLVATGVEEEVANNVFMSVIDGQLNVNLPSSENVAIYTVDGRMIAEKACAAGSNYFNLNGNMYIVKVGNKTYKVIVK